MSAIDELISRSLKGRTGRAEEQQLLDWRNAAPENERYFQQLMLLLETASAVAGPNGIGAMPTGADLTELAEAESHGRVLEIRPRRRRAGTWTAGVGMAAAITLVALAAWFVTQESGPEFRLGAGEFVTGPSETGTVTLSDGTVVRMAPRTRLRVLETPNYRDIFLTGKAYFAVARMAQYPFRVRTNGGDVVALGTRFEVRAEDDVRVVVAEGRVALQGGTGRVEVDAGEMSILLDDSPSAPVKVDVAPILAWVGSFVAFQSTPLRQVAVELEHEYDARVILTDSALADLTITGWYVDRSFEEVITIICGVLGAPCSVQNGMATIGSSSPNGR